MRTRGLPFGLFNSRLVTVVGAVGMFGTNTEIGHGVRAARCDVPFVVDILTGDSLLPILLNHETAGFVPLGAIADLLGSTLVGLVFAFPVTFFWHDGLQLSDTS